MGEMAGENVDWDKWFVFLADERYVPIDAEDSNYKSLNQEFLDKVRGRGEEI